MKSTITFIIIFSFHITSLGQLPSCVKEKCEIILKKELGNEIFNKYVHFEGYKCKLKLDSVTGSPCKNLKTRPFCSPEYAFAILKVGNPPKQKKQLKLLKEQRGPSFVLKLDFLNKSKTSSDEKLEWFLDGKKLNRYYNYKEIPILAYGTYKVMWYNCNETESITYKVTEKN